MNIKERFHETIDYFYENNHHLAGQISKLGYPEVTLGYPPTAGVMWDADKKRVKFMFNKKFSEKVTDEEFRFAVAHEAMHVINGHIFYLQSEVDKLKKGGKSDKEIRKFQMKFNIAADCVVNDTLVNLYGVKKVEFADADGKSQICYGQDIVGCDCHELSVVDVMQLLPENAQGEPDNHGWESFFNKDGSLKKEFVDAVKDFLEDNMGNSSLSGEESDVLEGLKEAMEGSHDRYAREAGHSAKSRNRALIASNASVSWEKLVFRKTDSKRYEDVWTKNNRKLSGFYPDVLLPYTQFKEVEDIFIAIDVSGSIDWEALKLFASVVKNTPKSFKINAITFNTKCEPYDINSDNIRAGGGTCFHIIEDYIQNNFKKYPKVVFVLTDGCGNEVNPQYPERWTWLLYSYCQTTYCKGMTHYELKKLLK